MWHRDGRGQWLPNGRRRSHRALSPRCLRALRGDRCARRWYRRRRGRRPAPPRGATGSDTARHEWPRHRHAPPLVVLTSPHEERHGPGYHHDEQQEGRVHADGGDDRADGHQKQEDPRRAHEPVGLARIGLREPQLERVARGLDSLTALLGLHRVAPEAPLHLGGGVGEHVALREGEPDGRGGGGIDVAGRARGGRAERRLRGDVLHLEIVLVIAQTLELALALLERGEPLALVAETFAGHDLLKGARWQAARAAPLPWRYPPIPRRSCPWRRRR